jgi:hypothetical protein
MEALGFGKYCRLRLPQARQLGTAGDEKVYWWNV